jgi:hypothetical protein
MGDYVYLVQMDIPAEMEEEFNRVYDTQHVPNIIQRRASTGAPGTGWSRRIKMAWQGTPPFTTSIRRMCQRLPVGWRNRKKGTGRPKFGPTPPTGRTPSTKRSANQAATQVMVRITPGIDWTRPVTKSAIDTMSAASTRAMMS